jgi:1-acyl-sn-glycerol-3-phosphate acyltransferase
MALESGVPVIPVAMIGTYEIQPPGRIVPRIRRVGMRFGPPMDFTRYDGLGNDRFILRSVTDEIMYAMMQLSEQEYVDVYASRAKELAAGARQEQESESGE